MKKETTEYYCDLCNIEISDNYDRNRLRISLHFSDKENKLYRRYDDLCEDCRNKIELVINSIRKLCGFLVDWSNRLLL